MDKVSKFTVYFLSRMFVLVNAKTGLLTYHMLQTCSVTMMNFLIGGAELIGYICFHLEAPLQYSQIISDPEISNLAIGKIFKLLTTKLC